MMMITRMTTIINAELKKYQKNIDKVAANISEYHVKSKLIFLRNIIPKELTLLYG